MRLPVDIPCYKYRNKTAIVIGAGIAGVSTAYALAGRGWQVTVLEKSDAIASGASGNLAGIIMPSLAAKHSPMGIWQDYGYQHIMKYLEKVEVEEWYPVGVLQVASAIKKVPKDAVYMNAEEASSLLGVTLTEGGVWFAGGGYISPAALCQSFFNAEPSIELYCQWKAVKLDKNNQGKWVVTSSDGQEKEAAVVVVAGAYEALQLSQCEWLPMKPLKGQVSYITGEGAPSLKAVLCADGYIIPHYQGQVAVGATYDYTEDVSVTADGHRRNMALFDSVLKDPLLYHEKDVSGRSSLRAVTSDRLPIIGSLPNIECYKKRVSSYFKSYKGRAEREVESLFYSGLYVNIAYGSRGLSLAPAGGEFLAALIEGEAPMLEEEARHVLPQRFLWRLGKKDAA